MVGGAQGGSETHNGVRVGDGGIEENTGCGYVVAHSCDS